MAAYDVNADGVIDADEMTRILADKVMVPGASGTVTSIDLQAVDVAGFMNRGVPNDMNGSLSRDELDAALVTDEGLTARPGIAADLLAMYDDNGDGVLDHAEVAQMVKDGVLTLDGSKPQGVALAAVPVERALRVTRQDADKNGSFSMDEFLTFLKHRGCSATAHDVEVLFAMYDRNGDGVVDQKELGAMMKEGVLGAVTPNGLVLSLNLGKAKRYRVAQALVSYANKLQPPDLHAALAWFNGGEVGISSGALRFVLDSVALKAADVQDLLRKGVFRLSDSGVISVDVEQFFKSWLGGAPAIPGAFGNGFPGPAEAEKSDFYVLVKTLSWPAAQKMMDMLEVQNWRGIENGRFGTYGLKALAGLSADDPLWDSCAPELSYSQRLDVIAAAREALDPKNAAFLDELHGSDGVFERGDFDLWLRNYDGGTVVSDQHIDPSGAPYKQGRAGNCYVLASIFALAETPAGRKLLQDSITQGPNGSYTVTFAGDPSVTITVTREDLRDRNDFWGKGDLDVRILEIAVEKYMAQHPERNHGRNTTLYGGVGGDVLALLGGKSATIPQFIYRGTEEQTVAFLELLASAPGQWVGLAGFKVLQDKTILPRDSTTYDMAHSMTIANIDASSRTVTLVDPADTGKVIVMSFEEFASKAIELTLVSAPAT